MALLKVGNYERAEQVASSVLEIDPENIKALGRRAVARAELNNLLGAAKVCLRIPTGLCFKEKSLMRFFYILLSSQQDYEKVLLLEPGNSEVLRSYSELAMRLLKMNDLEIPNTTTPIPVARKTGQSLLSVTNAESKDLSIVRTDRIEDSNSTESHFKLEDRNALVQLSNEHYDDWVKQQPKSAMIFETLWKECAPDIPKRAGLLAAVPGDRLKGTQCSLHSTSFFALSLYLCQNSVGASRSASSRNQRSISVRGWGSCLVRVTCCTCAESIGGGFKSE